MYSIKPYSIIFILYLECKKSSDCDKGSFCNVQEEKCGKYFMTDVFIWVSEIFETPTKQKINFNFDLEEGCVAINGDEKGSPCVFPFNYRVNVGNVTVIGFEFKACTKYEHTQYWCSTKVDEYGNHMSRWPHSEGGRTS